MSKFAAAMSILGDAGIDYRRIMQNPARAAKIAAAVDDGPEAVVDLANAMLRGGRPATPPAPAGRDPMPFEDRIAGNTTLRKGLEELGISTEGMSQEQVMDAAAKAFKADGAPRGRPKQAAPPTPLPSSPLAGRVAGRRPRSTEDSIRELAKPADQVAAESIAGQFDRVIGGDAPTRQMELPLSDDVQRQMELAQEQAGAARLFSPQAGLKTVDGEPAFDVLMRRNMEASPQPKYDDFTFDEVPPRPASTTAPSRGFPKKAASAAAGIAGLGGAAYYMNRPGAPPPPSADASVPQSDETPAVTSGGEADLVAESRPAPQVDATADVPEPTVAQAPRDYSMEARALINRLNDMRRAAGGEVPEARAMMAEINRLLELGNQTRRATMVAAPQDDASRLFQQAQALIDQVNQMYRQGMTPNSPEVQRAMAQVRQLQAQGDAIRNRRAG